MRSRLAVFAVVLAVPALAQPMTFDVAQFTIPDGFKVERQQNQVQTTYVDQGRGAYLQLVIYKSYPSSGSPQQDFTSEWSETVAKSFDADVTPSPKNAKTAAGPCLEGDSDATSSIGRSYVHLYVFSPAGKVVSVMVTATNREFFDSMQPTLATFFKSLHLPAGGPGAAAPTPPPANAAPPPKRGNAKWTGAPIVGIWFGIKDSSSLDYSGATNSFYFTLSKHSPRWRTFLGDGSSFEDLPTDGLLSLDLATARADPNSGRFWGMWTVNGDKVTATQPSGRVQEYHLDGDTLKEDPKTTGHTIFWRTKSVDGLKLEGSWSHWTQWDESQRAPNWKTVPVISFTRDGRFVDRGAFMYNVIDELTPESAPRHPGKGTYEIRGYTLVLRYDDGRELHRTFTAAAKKDPAKDSSVIFINKFPFYRF